MQNFYYKVRASVDKNKVSSLNHLDEIDKDGMSNSRWQYILYQKELQLKSY